MQTTSLRTPAGLSREQRLELYRFVRLTREVEERLTILFRQSKVIGGLYRSLGQEGESVAAAYALDATDAVFPLIRNLGALITMGVRPRDIFAQYMAKGASPSRGRDLNIHFTHLPPPGTREPVIIGPISMLGTSIPVAAGVALASKMRGDARVALAFIGDGAMSTGAFHEGMNFAAVQKLPLVVVAEDNKYAYSTPTSRQFAVKTIDERAASYGMPHEMVDGNDMLAVYVRVKEAVDRARRGDGPSMIGVETMRMSGHAQHDDMRYVPKPLLERWQKRDPIARFRAALVEQDAAGEHRLDEMDRELKAFAAAEADLAGQMPMPDPAGVTAGVYHGEHFSPRVEIARRWP
ncbi:MAG TPA: thiamine pyrophosphate-dependent dehydrogenase E1 component subunit alpha [Vicinamibacterales bacterium]|nr:thiamine pyrophosphate-dependent dehydrogenase E1 component subunit alpha [Vicinamibacterales bacterium]